MARRYLLHLAILATVLLAALLAAPARADGVCQAVKVTGYASSQFGGRTATGEATRGSEWSIVAVDYRAPRVPLGGVVWLEDIGTLRVADTGYLAAAGVDFDVLVSTVAEAYSLTGWRLGCW